MVKQLLSLKKNLLKAARLLMCSFFEQRPSLFFFLSGGTSEEQSDIYWSAPKAPSTSSRSEEGPGNRELQDHKISYSGCTLSFLPSFLAIFIAVICGWVGKQAKNQLWFLLYYSLFFCGRDLILMLARLHKFNQHIFKFDNWFFVK